MVVVVVVAVMVVEVAVTPVVVGSMVAGRKVVGSTPRPVVVAAPASGRAIGPPTGAGTQATSAAMAPGGREGVVVVAGVGGSC